MAQMELMQTEITSRSIRQPIALVWGNPFKLFLRGDCTQAATYLQNATSCCTAAIKRVKRDMQLSGSKPRLTFPVGEHRLSWVLALGVPKRDRHKILKIALAPEDQRIVVKDNMRLETNESIAEAQMQESGVEVERGLRDTERGRG